MPRSFGTAPKQSATDIAAALLTEDVAPEPAAPEVEPEAQPEVQPQPERGPRRDQSGRFAPRDESVPSEPVEQPQAADDTGESDDTPPPADDAAAIRAELERQRQENERLRKTYEANTRQQREALEQARREAEELRAAKKAERDQLFAQARTEVEAMPDGPDRWRAERQLANAEFEEAQRLRREVDEERQQQEQARQEQARSQADLAARTGLWGVVEAYAAKYAAENDLPDEEAVEALKSLQTPELAILFRTMHPTQLIDHVRNVVGNRLHDELERRRAGLAARREQETERNRQDAVASGAHGHVHIPGQTAPQPAYVAYTRENKSVRLGRRAAAEAIMAGMLDE